MTRYLRRMRGLRLCKPGPDLLSTMKIGALGAVFGSLWDPPRERGPSVLEGLIVTPPTEELLARIDRAERGEEEMEPKMEPNEKPTATTPMSFGDALAALKAGKRVARTGWNGKGMWLVLVEPEALISCLGPDELLQLPWIGMKTADECFVPWLASQTDLLAEDWVEVAS